jgi:hypothetical protein
LYCKNGQTTEDEMFTNEHGSKDFEEFLDCMGQRIKLKVCDRLSVGGVVLID